MNHAYSTPGLPHRIFQFFVYSNLFIAACALLMANQTFEFLLGQKANLQYMGFLFFSTLCSYSFHWYLSGPSNLPSDRIEWLGRNRLVHLIFFAIGLSGSVWLLFTFLDHWIWFLAAIIATFLYSAPKLPHSYFRALRKIALGKTIFLALVWMYVTTVLPVVILDHPWTPAVIYFSCSRFFLVYAICILFDYRDRVDDKSAGIRSLITYLGEVEIRRLFHYTPIFFLLFTLLLLLYNYSLLSVILLILPGIITWFLYGYATTHFKDLFYYFILDGLMALSAVFMLIVPV